MDLLFDLEAGGLPRLMQLLVPVPINPSPRYFDAVEATSPYLRMHTGLV